MHSDSGGIFLDLGQLLKKLLHFYRSLIADLQVLK